MDATAYVQRSGEERLGIYFTEDAGANTSKTTYFTAPWNGVSLGATWIAKVEAGVPHTFRLMLEHAYVPNCRQFTSCGAVLADVSISALTMLFGQE